MAIIKTVTVDGTRCPSLTNHPIVIPLDATDFNFAQVQSDGRNLDVVDSGGASLAHALRDWGTGIGLHITPTTLRLPSSGFGNSYNNSTNMFYGDLGYPNPPHVVTGVGSINDPAQSFGQWDAWDKFGNHLWTFASPAKDYPMSCCIGDIDLDGVNEVAVGARFADHAGYLLNRDGTLRWSYVFPQITDNYPSPPQTSYPYIRIARIGKLRNDYAGNQVLFGGAMGQLAMLDKLGNQIWRVQLPGAQLNVTCQAALIDDLDSSGTNYIFVPQSQNLYKIDNTGSIVWTWSQYTPPPMYCYKLAAGHITSLASKQIATFWNGGTGGAGTTSLTKVAIVDNNGATVWNKVLQVPCWAVTVGDLNGDGYDEVILNYGGSAGGLIVLDRNGEELAMVTNRISAQDIHFVDSDGSGRKRISTYSGLDLQVWDYGSPGASVKAILPSLAAGEVRDITLQTSANPTLNPPSGDYLFDFSAADGSSPPVGFAAYGAVTIWTIQGGTLQSPSQGDAANVLSCEAGFVSADAAEIEFTAQKVDMGTGASVYYHGLRYRCTNWVTNTPDCYHFQLGSNGSYTLSRYASGAPASPVTIGTASGGPTFTTSDVIRLRVVYTENDHAVCYRKNGGPWTLLYHWQDATGSPVTGAGSVAFIINRGQSRFSSPVVQAIPQSYSMFGGTGPAPRLRLAPNAVSSDLLTESGWHVLSEDGDILLVETSTFVIVPGVDPFAATTTLTTADPFASTAKYKGG